MITALVHVTLVVGQIKTFNARIPFSRKEIVCTDVSKNGLNESHYLMLRLISQGKTITYEHCWPGSITQICMNFRNDRFESSHALLFACTM